MKKRIKILALSHDFVKKVNFRIYEELSKEKKFNVTCVGPKFFYEANKKIFPDFKSTFKTLKFIKKNFLFKRGRFFYFKNISNILKNANPDVVILHNDPISIQSLILIFYSYFYNFKICCMSNENNLINFFKKPSLKKFFKIAILFFLNLIVKRKINHIFCISNQIMNNYNFLGYKNKTVLIPLGYDERIFKIKKIKRNKKFVISYFGRISKDKGIHILINALNKIKFNFDFMLDIDQIENQNYFDNLMIKLRNVLPVRKIKLIKCNHISIAKYMSKSNLVVLPSLYEEQYGRVIQESVACGSLVIGSRVGAVPEIIKDKDLLFEPGNDLELANKINRVSNRSFFKKKFQLLYFNIINERTIGKQMSIIKNLKILR